MAINKRKIPAVNAGSMADISFLLLIFFLVATHMNTDFGLNRILPPWNPEEETIDIIRRNVLQVFVRSDNVIMVGDEVMELDKIKDKAKEFVVNREGDPDLPEIEMQEIENLPVTSYPVSKGVVSLRNDRGTNYGRYVAVQNELVKAFNELREEASRRIFTKSYADLNKEQQDAIAMAIPVKISEAEPYTIEGGN